MGKDKSSRIKLSTDQYTLLREIIRQQNNSMKGSGIFKYRDIWQKFNKQCQRMIPNHKEYSQKAVQGKVKQICNISKPFWNHKLDQLTIELVTEGLSWKNMEDHPQFAIYGLKSIVIKRNFQIGARSKYRIICKKVWPQMENQYVRDPTYKAICQPEQIQKHFIIEAIDQYEKQCLLNHLNLFRTSLRDSGGKLSRRTQTTHKTLAMVSLKQARTLITAILKIDKIGNVKNELDELINPKIKYLPIFQCNTKVSPSVSASNSLFGDLYQNSDIEPDEIQHHLNFHEEEEEDLISNNNGQKCFNFNEEFDVGHDSNSI